MPPTDRDQNAEELKHVDSAANHKDSTVPESQADVPTIAPSFSHPSTLPERPSAGTQFGDYELIEDFTGSSDPCTTANRYRANPPCHQRCTWN